MSTNSDTPKHVGKLCALQDCINSVFMKFVVVQPMQMTVKEMKLGLLYLILMKHVFQEIVCFGIS